MGVMLNTPALAAAGGALALVGALAFVAPASAAPTPVVTAWPTTAGSDPEHITVGPDGNLWFTEEGTNSIGRITTAGVVTEFPVPTPAANLQGITSGPDGNLWFTEGDTNKIGQITPAGVITEFSLAAGAGPSGIIAAADGNLWFTEEGNEKIGVIDTTGTVLHEYPVATVGDQPNEIVVGSDGNLWYTNFGEPSIGTTDITTGTATDYPVGVAVVGTRFLALGSDGNVWFSTSSFAANGNVTPAGTVSIIAGMDEAGVVTNGPDGNLRIGDSANGTIDTITPAGVNIAQYGDGTTFPPSSLVTGPDGNIWFTVNDSVDVLNLNPPAAAPAAPKPSLASTGAGPWTSWLTVGGVIALGLGAILAMWAVVGRARRTSRVD
ncbi:MAG: putative antibiotic hydrolase [Microbacteriaceae bacterium]|jgi:streptogramin lyase|nr:putative antibiotic hydrolase [Microbacteriaceae bacterium]